MTDLRIVRRAATLLAFSAACGGDRLPASSPEGSASAPAARDSLGGAAAATVAPRADAALLPRKVIFGNPHRGPPQLSPNGRYLSWLAPKDGVMNVYVAPRADVARARAVTNEKNRPIPEFSWTYDNEHVLYALDDDGDDDVHVFSVNVETSALKDLTPFEKTTAQLMGLSERHPGVVLIGMNDRDAQFHDVYRVDVTSGKRELVQKSEAYTDFVADAAFQVRFALKPSSDGGFDLMRSDGKGGFSSFQTIPSDDSASTGPLRFDKRGKVLYMQDSRERDTSALIGLDTKTQEATLLAEDGRADVEELLTSPIDGHAQAVSFEYDRRAWRVLDKVIAPDFDYLETVVDGDLNIISRSQKDDFWTISYVVSDGPVRHYLYDRTKKTATFLFTNRPALEGVKLAKMYPVVIPTRDGKSLVSYLSLPPAADHDGTGKPSEPQPMVLLVHGGPWARDSWGYNGWHQWLATRGYAVLAVNYRGSTGFGKAFLNSADREWGGKMHEDLIDAAEWAKQSGIADRQRVAIMGGSYGGYATLVGLTFTPKTLQKRRPKLLPRMGNP